MAPVAEISVPNFSYFKYFNQSCKVAYASVYRKIEKKNENLKIEIYKISWKRQNVDYLKISKKLIISENQKNWKKK